MNETRLKSIPLPCALLALSVAVCLGAAGTVEASTLRSTGTAQAEQRPTLEHLLEAIQQAAKKLTDRLDGQLAVLPNQSPASPVNAACDAPPAAQGDLRVPPLLREALLNLPPPAC